MIPERVTDASVDAAVVGLGWEDKGGTARCVNTSRPLGTALSVHPEGTAPVQSILPPNPDGKSVPWSCEVRDAARNAVVIAADQHRAVTLGADRTLAYYLRIAVAHGMTISEIVDAGDLDASVVLRLLDPAECD